MQRLMRFLRWSMASLLVLAALATGVALVRAQPAWLWAIPAGVLLDLLAFVLLGLRGSRGGLWMFLRGQFPPILRDWNPSIQVGWESATPVYEAEAEIGPGVPVARVEARFLSVAIDLSQVSGGKWWDPRAGRVEFSSGSLPAPVFDFDRPLLNRLAAALSPCYLRIGGSEADKIFYAPDDSPLVPAGYQSVLTRRQWDRLHAFCDRHGMELVFTLNAGPAARAADGAWNPGHAEALMARARAQGQRVSVWELGNEMNVFFFVHGFRAQINPQQHLRDLHSLRALARKHFPDSRVAGQGSAYWPVLGEPLGFFFGFAREMLRQAAGLVDLFTWHYYPQQSRRCPAGSRRAHPARLLDPYNLDEAAHWAGQINALRDVHAPGLPVWLGETGNAQCGGAPGLSDRYLAGLWWLDQLGLMARCGQQVVVRQTLTGSDYGLLDEETLAPRPDYWNSLLWKRLMGSEVLAVRVVGSDRLRVYAHRAASGGGISLLAINLDPARAARLRLPQFAGLACEKHLLTAPDVLGGRVFLNGRELALLPQGALPDLAGEQGTFDGVLSLPPLGYAFVKV